MSERTDSDFLNHIAEAVRRTSSYTEKMTCEEFFGDTKTQDAVNGKTAANPSFERTEKAPPLNSVAGRLIT